MKHASLVLAGSLIAVLALAAPPCRAEDKAAALGPVTREVRLLHRYDQDPPAAATTMMTFDPAHMVPLKNGLNWVDLDGDGIDDLVVKGRYDHQSAHDFSTFMFLKRYADPEAEGAGKWAWRIVGLLDERGLPKIPDSTHEGADYILRDFRLLIDKRAKPYVTHLIIGDRPLGESYTDPSPITFRILRYEEVVPHPFDPPVRMVVTAEIVTEKSYKDVEAAFLKELHLPDSDPVYQ